MYSLRVRKDFSTNYVETGEYKHMQDRVKIIEVRSYAPENEKGWGGIESENGEEKWISLDYVTKLDIPSTVKVDTDNVGVYKGPGSNS